MASVLVCSNGHRWEITGADLSVHLFRHLICPVCGQKSILKDQDHQESTAINISPPLSPQDETPPGESADVQVGDVVPKVRQDSMPTIPGYGLIGLLGQGGMGKVYQARHLRLGRMVALKTISTDQASPQQFGRFQVEAQALARMQNPNIVQIYEVSEWNSQPYISLEFVEGGSLEGKLDGKPQPPGESARMVETLARAIHAAHKQGIIHRDLKPGNILLTSEGQPKITDFGLAKRLEEDVHQTLAGAILGTPPYMAPEQAAGEAVGPGTDVYALGIILYEMLTGRPPFRGISALQTLELVRFTEPVSPKRLQPGVPRDLDTICLKCLEKQPERRYLSAGDLAEDLGRFLSNQPIQARRAGRVERMSKWIKRHPARAALIGVILAAGFALAGLGAWSNVRLRQAAERAEARSRLARAVVNDMYTKVAEEWLAEEPFKDSLRQEFLEKALELYQDFVQESGRDPEVRGENARAFFRLGQIHRMLNQHSQSQDAYSQAISLQEKLSEEYPQDPRFRQDLANSYNGLGEFYREKGGYLAEAELNYVKAMELQEKLAAANIEEPSYRKELARSHYNLGIVHMDLGQKKAAEKNLGRAIQLLAKLHQEHPQTFDFRHELARCFINSGVLHKENDQPQKAKADYGRAIELLQKLKDQGYARVVLRSELAVARLNLGNLLLEEGRHAQALQELGQGAEVLRRLLEDFPKRPTYKNKLANAYNSLAAVHAHLKEHQKAEEHWQLARTHFQVLVQEFPGVSYYQKHLGMVTGNLGWLRSNQKDWQTARVYLEQALPHLREALKSNPKEPETLHSLRQHTMTLAESLVQLGDHGAAAKIARTLPEVYKDRAQDFYFGACYLARCIPLVEKGPHLSGAKVRTQWTGDYEEQAMALLREAVRIGSGNVKRLPNEPEIFQSILANPQVKKLLADLGPSP